jgi:hypothetical protein
MVAWMNGWAQEYLEQWLENCLEHRMEKYPEWIRPEERKRLEKQPEKRPERGFPRQRRHILFFLILFLFPLVSRRHSFRSNTEDIGVEQRT